MLWAAAIKQAMIGTAALALATLLYRIARHAPDVDLVTAAPVLVPLLAGAATTAAVALHRERRRAAALRRFRR